MQIVYLGYGISPENINEAVQSQLYTYIRRLSKEQGLTVTVIDLNNSHYRFLKSIKLDKNVRYISIMPFPLRSRIIGVFLNTFVRGCIVHLVSPFSYIFSEYSGLKNHVIQTINDVDTFVPLLQKLDKKSFSLFIENRRFIVESERAKKKLIQIGVPAEVIHVLPPMIDSKLFREHQKPLKDYFTIVFASAPLVDAHFETRGVYPLLKAMKKLRGQKIKLVIPWRSEELLSKIKKIREELELTHNTTIITESVAMAFLYSKGTVTVAPFAAHDNNKDIPTSIIESLSCNRPVIVTRFCANYELIEKKGVGVVVEPTPKDLIRGILELKENYSLFYKNGKCRKFAVKEYGVKALNKLYELYGLDRRGINNENRLF